MAPIKQRDGRNSNIAYYFSRGLGLAVPNWTFRARLKRELSKLVGRPDREYIESRLDYYCKLNELRRLPEEAIPVSQLSLSGNGSVYFFDTYEHARWFDPRLRMLYLFGDITYVPAHPAIVKSRPIAGDNANSVIMKLEKMRHFVFIKDRKAFRDKKDMIIFRGDIKGKPHRVKLFDMYLDHPMCDIGNVTPGNKFPPEWSRGKKTLWEHLDYKFIFSLEGNDVATNLKWVMSSNSIAVMPRPVYETWFMEGTLIPNYHYIEIKADYSDLEERLQYYIDHPREAEAIIRNANDYVRQFQDDCRERLLSLLVLQKYFLMTGQF